MQPKEIKPEKNATVGADSFKRILISEELFSGKSEVMIKHKNDFYRLMITKAGKLILNK